jgi:dihydroorotate dehydrogenase
VQERNRELAGRAGGAAKPVFVKIAPDMTFAELDSIIEVVEEVRVDGIVATNATAFMRDKLKSVNRSEAGGLSGRPISALVTSFIEHIYRSTRGRVPIIGVGGIFSAADAYEKIAAGANAVQIYTGWIYEGPAAVRRINLGLLRLLERDGLSHISEAVGYAHGDRVKGR